MRFLFPHHLNTIRTNKQTHKLTNKQQSSFNNIDFVNTNVLLFVLWIFGESKLYTIPKSNL